MPATANMGTVHSYQTRSKTSNNHSPYSTRHHNQSHIPNDPQIEGYYLRSRARARNIRKSLLLTPSPVSPRSPNSDQSDQSDDSPSPSPIIRSNVPSPMLKTRTKSVTTRRNQRKRRFSQIDNMDSDSKFSNSIGKSIGKSMCNSKLNQSQYSNESNHCNSKPQISEITVNVSNIGSVRRSKRTKRSNPKYGKTTKIKKYSGRTVNRSIKINLNDQTVAIRNANIPADAPIVSPHRPKRRSSGWQLECFAVSTHCNNPSLRRKNRRKPFICCYEFGGGFTIGIAARLGSTVETKEVIAILSQELVPKRVKASLETRKMGFLPFIKSPDGELVGCGVLHVDNEVKRVNIEMFAVDEEWRGNGLASLMVFLIQNQMVHYPEHDLFVCAASDAVPFWTNDKYKFHVAHKQTLEEHELVDEKKGNVLHLIWSGSPPQARALLLDRFQEMEGDE